MKHIPSIVSPAQEGLSFVKFIFKLAENRRWGMLSLGFSLTGMLLLQLAFPHPGLVLDSYCLVRGAVTNANVEVWPVGYSKFLVLLGYISHSAALLVTVQYLLMTFACLFLFFTLLYFFSPGRSVKVGMFILLFANPLLCYMHNFVLTDSLFTALSITWFTLLIWIIYRPKAYLVWLQALLLLIVFSLRYSAMIYPVIGAGALLLSSFRWPQKLLAILLQVMVISIFVGFTSYEMKRVTGVHGYTVFSGWKLANNALFSYGHYYKDDLTPVPPPFAGVDSFVRRHFDQHGVDNMANYDAFAAGSAYMFHAMSPLVLYMKSQHQNDLTFITLQQSMPMARLYGAYGLYLIKRHPGGFLEYFVLPNVQRHLLPPMEVFENNSPFGLRGDALGEQALTWFNISGHSLAPTTLGVWARDILLVPASFLACIIQVLFWMVVIGVWYTKYYKGNAVFNNKIMLLVLVMIIVEFAFSIVSAGIVMRYLLFILVVQGCFTLIIGEQLLKTEQVRSLLKD